MSAPAVKCKNQVKTANKRCKKKMPFDKVCDVTNILLPICEVAGMGKLLCLFPATVHFVASSATKGFTKAIDNLERQFYVEFDISHNFTFHANVSKTPSEIKDAIIGELDERTRTFRLVLGWCSRLLSITFLYLFIKAWRYRKKYLSRDKFDNIYVTAYLEKVDRKRIRRGWDGILPLSKKESKKYIKPSPGSVGLSVQGEGLLADVYKVFVNTLDPNHLHNFTVDTTRCLPHPSPPDLAAYETIRL
ncbi:DC-STAMP domain-containing protein 2-like [Amphiura filiformis]|uniref:DC-STAMP domain-containing protein 2-like n=1 Tax=Amphiura filiformis TaxID=82378 RepID=UPI003B20C65E